MRFLIDENLPAALARWLNSQGHQAEHTSALGLNRTPDLGIARHALQAGAVIVTKDSDYLSIAPAAFAPHVVHVGVGNASTAALLDFCGIVWPGVVAQLEAGVTQVKVARDAGDVS